eukprot:3711886-Pyramimonas_sp.AAC.1
MAMANRLGAIARQLRPVCSAFAPTQYARLTVQELTPFLRYGAFHSAVPNMFALPPHQTEHRFREYLACHTAFSLRGDEGKVELSSSDSDQS